MFMVVMVPLKVLHATIPERVRVCSRESLRLETAAIEEGSN